MNRNMSN